MPHRNPFKEKDMKLPGSRRKKIFKKRLRHTVENVIKEYVKLGVIKENELHEVREETLSLFIRVLKSEEFKGSIRANSE